MTDTATEEDYYKTIDREGVAEFKDRGSRFIAYTFPIQNTDEFKSRLLQLKKEHVKAVHHCFAYRLGLDKNNFRSSDDGEPSGSAGKPILGQIDSKGLTNVLIVVVRYFGGTLLGVPGLINAYKSAAALALQVVPVIQKPVTSGLKINFGYGEMNDVMRTIKQFNATIIHQELNLFCHIEIEVERNKLLNIKQTLSHIYGVEIVDQL